jgi:hypothetical protein
MKTLVTLFNCTRSTVERKLIEANFKQYLDSVASPEQLLHLKNYFDSASTTNRKRSEYQRIYSNAFWYAAKDTKRKENKQWYFGVAIV